MAGSAPDGDFTLSIVTTLYRSSATIAEFHARCSAAAAPLTPRVEFILVDDGSPDDSLAVARDLVARDPRVVVLELARNFGHHKAMMTGLAQARGDLVFLIDCDLEEPPELLARFYTELKAGAWDVVYGVQRRRRGGLFERLSGAVYFSLVEALSDLPLSRNLITARLMSRPYVQALVAHRDREMQISHLWAITGFRQTALPVDKLSLSPTSYSLKRKVEMAVEHIITTSTKILYFILYSGFAISATSAMYICYSLFKYFVYGAGVHGYYSLIVSLWFFGGTTIFILGILGIYIANILSEVKRRPYTHLRAIHRASDDDTAPGAQTNPLLDLFGP
ncbi:glycosyltransferase family 2 protein [Azospirillum sp. B4]|uniref:glycosyltransferase family 2 protein n=1 Tax=Azospirillum sp. B4 TaxID=95605 RepID=UPI00034AFE5D|nr:glycosyltransferase family 2 protein [Azospirillum sp. B4]